MLVQNNNRVNQPREQTTSFPLYKPRDGSLHQKTASFAAQQTSEIQSSNYPLRSKNTQAKSTPIVDVTAITVTKRARKSAAASSVASKENSHADG